MHEVVQVLPQHDFTVYVYFSDGAVKLYDPSSLLTKGVFKKISQVKPFIEKCTVMNGTLAWDLSGCYDPYTCIDIDPDTIYEEGLPVKDPLDEEATAG